VGDRGEGASLAGGAEVRSGIQALRLEAAAVHRPHGVFRLLALALRLYGRYPLLFLVLAAGVVVPFELCVLAITGKGPLAKHVPLSTSIVLIALETGLVVPLISSFHMHAVKLVGEGERPRVPPVVRSGLGVLPVVAAADIMSSLGIYLGLLALILPGVVLLVRWAVVAQSAAVEHEGWQDALSRSGQLTSQRPWHVSGLILVVTLISVGAGRGISAAVSGGSAGAASVAIGIAERSLLLSFDALALALLYYDLCAGEALPASPRRSAANGSEDAEPSGRE
jgi:hypothetical protein